MCFKYPEELKKDSFRIFTLEPGEEEDNLHGSLQIHRLDAAPVYEALSYEWGKRSESKSMKCNSYDFKIIESLDIALRRLRLTDKPRSLWIDQICINQDSYDERSAQVSIMRLIYSNAAMVIAWLGPADTEATNSVKDIITTFCNLQEYVCDGDHFPDDDRLKELNLPLRDSRAWNDLNSMLGASYFSRVWIIQELAASSEFQLLWGNITISKDEYESMRERIFFLSMTQADARKGCPETHLKSVALHLLREKARDDKDLFKLVRRASRSKATMQQDKIYALIGLAGQCHYDMEPDYSKSDSEVFADFATRVISTNKNLDIVDYAYVADPDEPKRRPLWAPRWQPENQAVGFIHGGYKASKDIKAIWKASRNLNVLEMRGIEIDVVKDVHHRGAAVHEDIEAAFGLVSNHQVSFEQTYELEIIKVVILTMMAGREKDVLWVALLKRPEDESYLDNFITYVVSLLHETGQPPDSETDLGFLCHLALDAKTKFGQNGHYGADKWQEQAIYDEFKRRYPDNPKYASSALGLFMILQQSKKNQCWYRFMQSTSISKGLNFFLRN